MTGASSVGTTASFAGTAGSISVICTTVRVEQSLPGIGARFGRTAGKFGVTAESCAEIAGIIGPGGAGGKKQREGEVRSVDSAPRQKPLGKPDYSPRYACRTRLSFSNSPPEPDLTTRPFSSTYARWEILSDTATFCSTSMTVSPR